MTQPNVIAQYHLWNYSTLSIIGVDDIEKYVFKINGQSHVYKKSDFSIDTIDELEEMFDDLHYMIQQAIRSIPANVQDAYNEGVLYNEHNEMFEVELLYYVENFGNGFLPKLEFSISVPDKQQIYLLYGLTRNPIGSNKLRQSGYDRIVAEVVSKLENDLSIIGKPYSR